MARTTFTSEHEAELAEIKALSSDLNEQLKAGLATLHEIRQSQQQRLRAPGSNGGKPLLAFVHVPKTAGGTVISMFVAAYSRQDVRDGGNYLRNSEQTIKTLTRFPRPRDAGVRVLAGHVPFGVYREYLPAGTRYVTFLREPVDRVLSHYYRHVHIKDPRRAARHVAEPWSPRPGHSIKARSIEEAIVDMRIPHLNNLATRFLSGQSSLKPELPASALDDAMENLSGFAFVGVQERFEESLVLLQRMLQLRSIPYRDRHVSSSGSRPTVDELPEGQRELIAEYNRLDAELYEFGLGLFEQAVAAADDGFAEDVEALRARSVTAREEEWHETRFAQD